MALKKLAKKVKKLAAKKSPAKSLNKTAKKVAKKSAKPAKPTKLTKPINSAKPAKPAKPIIQIIQNLQSQQTQNPIVINKKNALLIGCNYIGSPYELYGCINDTNDIKNLLQSKYNFNNITILTDNTIIKPTRDNILNEFKNLLINSKSGDILFFSFSGHGSQTYDISSDENDNLDEIIITSDMKYIIDDEFNKLITEYLKDGVKLFALFDSCHSGSMMDLKYQYLDSNNYDNLTINNKYNNLNGNIVMISGCMDTQTSADAYINNIPRGAMTWSFIETINNTTSTKWLDIVKNMRNLLKINGYVQIPQLSSDKEVNTLFL